MHFYKYQGTGNDFILVDNREGDIFLNKAQITRICHRRYGIGADGLMLLETVADADFRMVYYNSDGGESTMCGNGGRCIAAFARRLGIGSDSVTFMAIDGAHTAVINHDETISLQMQDVKGIKHYDNHAELDTGSPHYVLWVGDTEHSPVFEEGRRIRNESRFMPGGTNVNFVEKAGRRRLRVRTYERGVEDETLSCGTGVTAAAIAASGDAVGEFRYDIETPGGMLVVNFAKREALSATNVVLTGPASFVYEGRVTV